MEIILLVIILIQFIFLIYTDVQNRCEREALELKLMSKGLSDYISSTEEDVPSAKEEESPYIDVEDASVEQILAAKDK